MITTLCLALHCHQPVGNFSWILEEAYANAYRPFLDVLEKHPKVPVMLHYSGILLDWFEREHPEFLKRLKGLVRRGQVEMMGGGHYEPILTMIPKRDALAQLQQMQETLTRLGLQGPSPIKGIWIAERVWEPELPSLLEEAGVRYTVVDDHHLELAGVPEKERFGHYLTEDRGASVALFPSLKALRYGIPFKPVDEVIEILRQMRSESPRVAVLADDGEKFGLWPGTSRWVYQEGWLESFFQQLEQSHDWLKLMTFGQCLQMIPPLGRRYLPCGSYEEMMLWSGGLFRNFLVKYPEANTMYRRMLWVSDRLEEMRSRGKAKRNQRHTQLLREAHKHLSMAQNNDAYWHGLFGGLYLRHLREAVYLNLIRAEQALDAVGGERSAARGEPLLKDGQGVAELLLRSNSLTLLLDLRQGGQLLEASDKASGINLLNTLTRRPEAYHERLRSKQTVAAASAKNDAPLSIHEQPEMDRPDLTDLLVYDPYRRAGWIDHLLDTDSEVQAFARGASEEIGDFLHGSYEGKWKQSGRAVQAVLTRQGRIRIDEVEHPLSVKKTVTLASEGRTLRFAQQLINRSNHALSFLFGTEFNLGLKDAHVNRIGEAEGIRRFSVVDPAARLELLWEFSRPARLWHFPLETVSDSERGMERTYQGVSLTFLWHLKLAARGSWAVQWEWRLQAPHGIS